MANSRQRGRGGGPQRVFALGVVVLVAAAALVWARLQLTPLNPGSQTTVYVVIPKGTSAGGLGELLTETGLVRSRYSIVIASMWSGDASRLTAGIYALSPGQSPQEMLRIIVGGPNARIRVTFPEGFTLRQVADRLQMRGMVDSAEFIEIARTEGSSFHCADGFTPPDDTEGYLFPWTYDFKPHETSREIIQDMIDQFDLAVVQAHPEVRDWRRPVILASLIEREAEIPKDRPLIAGVLMNRLRLGMPLQVDATVEYALPEHKARLLFSDLRTPSPYNTYLHRGLPPGAICNPGLPSIEAALRPADVDYLYYVQGAGHAHIFSRTLAEQDRNIAVVRADHPPT
jgi:UPF0755 protein